MLLLAELVLLPLAAMLCLWLMPSARSAGRLVCVAAAVHLIVTATTLGILFGAGAPDSVVLADGLLLDRTAAWFILLSALVGSASLAHAHVYFMREQLLAEAPALAQVKLFYSLSLAFLLSMTVIYTCDNLGFLWIGIEATTLITAGLVNFNRTKHALEATWKYFITCSVGIAFALLGTVLIFAASQHGAVAGGSLNVSELIGVAPRLDLTLCKLGFIFCFLGYGTKAGVFPLHSWLPDAHSEAPAPASAMLSGALLNGSLFALWRVAQIAYASPFSQAGRDIAIAMGAITVVAASLFLVRQHGLKRLWAYSSVENVGMMLIAIGLGSGSLFLLQAVNHSLAKVSLFLVSGNIIQSTGSKELADMRGIFRSMPVWALLLALSALAAAGAPPFGSFVSEMMILAAGADRGLGIQVAAVIVALALSFVAICFHCGRILTGVPKQEPVAVTLSSALIPGSLVVLCLILGVALPPGAIMVSR